MANEFEGGRSRRRYERVTGPFNGLIEDPVLVYDLNLGGCFINSPHRPPIGSLLILKIDLSDEGWITVSAEALYQHEHGFAVQFPALDGDSASRIERTVSASRGRRFGQWTGS
jgi:hypothetical protein